jgi:hypothetical protein
MTFERKHGIAGATLIALLLVVGLFANFAFGGESKGTSVGLRARLVTPAHQGKGLFVASLRGRSLRWSLAYKSSPRNRLNARIRLRRAGASVKLCGGCASLVRGKLRVSRTIARALTHRRAVVELRSAAASNARLSGPVILQAVPALEITSPRPGETVTLPAEVGYTVREVGDALQGSGLQLEVFVANGDGSHVRIPLAEPSGAVTLPDVKSAYLVGHHDLTFRLLNADGVPFPNPEATDIVRDLTIHGRKGG